MKEGIELAKDVLMQSRSKSALPIELFYGDDRGQGEDGIVALKSLIATYHVGALTGVVNSSVALALAPLLDEHKLVLVSGGASSPQLSGYSRFFFRTCPSDLEQARTMARFARGSLGLSRIAILYPNNAYGLGLREPFREAFVMLGGTIAAEDTFLSGATDFASQFAAIKQSKPDAVYLIGDPKEIGRCVQHARHLGLHWRFLSVSSFTEPEVLSIAGTDADGVISTDTRFDPDSPYPATRRFVELFKLQHSGRVPGALAATGFDALTVLVTALDEAKGEMSRVPDLLKAIHGLDGRDFEGAAGPIRFDENGDVRRPVRLTEVRNGVLVPSVPREPVK